MRRQTLVLEDATRGVFSTNDSPDIPFSVSLNPYRGCEHGCAYCYARPTHEYLGYSAGLDFETRILAKHRAPELLDRELMNPNWRPQPVAMSGVTDPYQPVESRLEITRRCLEVFLLFRNPVGLITKSDRILRDLDLLAELASHGAASVAISVTTLDPDLARRLEPRAAAPRRRLEAIRMLAEADIPVSVMVAPIIPGLTDHEIPAILRAARDAGATRAGGILLRLPHAVSEIFESWLDEHRPLRKRRVLGLIRASRGGKLNESRFKERFRGTGPIAAHIQGLLATQIRKLGFESGRRDLSTAAFRRPARGQLTLFP